MNNTQSISKQEEFERSLKALMIRYGVKLQEKMTGSIGEAEETELVFTDRSGEINLRLNSLV